MRLSRWPLIALLGAALLLLLAMAPAAQAVTQTYNGDVVQMIISDTSAPNINVKPSTHTLPGDLYVRQYYGGSSWGSVVWLNNGGTWSSYGSGYVVSGLSAVSNVTNVVPGGIEIVTVVNLGASGVQMTQRFTHLTGDRFVSKEWIITNNGATSFSGARFYHGGDSYFGGVDSAYGFYDPSKSMVYVRNNDYTNWGIMGFYANPATPADRYYEGYYYTGRNYAGARTDLPNTVDASFRDAGYYLEWDREGLAPGESWTIQAYEIWTAAGALQIIAPGSQNVAQDSELVLPFTIQNLGTVPLSLNLSAFSDVGWAAAVVGETSVVVAANSSVTENVRVTVPEGASGPCLVTLTASGDASGSATTSLTVADIDVAIVPPSIDFGSLAPGGSASQVVTATNNGSAPITFGTVSTIAPFGKTADGCSGVTLAPGGSCTVTATFSSGTSGTYNGSLNIPVVDPLLVTYTVSLTGRVASNAAPTGLSLDPGSVAENTPAGSLVGHFSTVDPDPGNTHTYTLVVGDGSAGNSCFQIVGDSLTTSGSFDCETQSSYSVRVRTTDQDGQYLEGVFTVMIIDVNECPVLVVGDDLWISEGQALIRGASFTDPDDADSWTASVDFGDGTGPTPLIVAPDKSFALSHTYGDNGEYPVTVSVSDHAGGTDANTILVTVENVAPSVELDKQGTILLNGRTFYLVRAGGALEQAARATDPGSDDLVFRWGASAPVTVFNDGLSPDPLPSPYGQYPVSCSAGGLSFFGRPGMFSASVVVEDDDGGIGSDGTMVIATGSESQKGEVADWLTRYVAPDAAGDQALGAYLEIARFFSNYLGVDTYLHRTANLRNAADAAAILSRYEEEGFEEQAEALLLAAWLNFACGAQQWGGHVDIDKDGQGDRAFCLVLAEVEQVLCQSDPSQTQLGEALDLLRSCFVQSQAEPATSFTDITPANSYYAAIQAVAAQGVVDGFSDGTFRPDEQVTRQQFAKMIVVALGLAVDGTETCPFGDVAANLGSEDELYPGKYIAVCAAHGIVEGKTATEFAPYDPILRQQLITMVERAADPTDPPPGFSAGFGAGQFSAWSHYLNARRAFYGGLLEGLAGLGADYDFLSPATRGECAQLLWNLMKLTQAQRQTS